MTLYKGVHMNLSRQAAAASACLALVVVSLSTRPAGAANLCPPLSPPVTDKDDRRRTEASFDAKNFSQALNYLKDDLPRALRENASTEDVRRDESFAIGYPNVMAAIEGYTLRQDALLRLAERDLMVERSQRGLVNKTHLASANARYQEARSRFCEFVRNNPYSD